MEGERLTTLEQALAELQAKDANTQHKLDILISHIPQSKNPIPSTQITPITLKAHGLKLALLSEFDGDRTKGMAFLNSCQVYICLCPNSFTDKQAKIVWAMSYMKAGRAAKWSVRVFQWEEQPEMWAIVNLLIGKTSETSSKESFVQSMQTQWPSTDWNPQPFSKRVTLSVLYPPPHIPSGSDQSNQIPTIPIKF